MADLRNPLTKHRLLRGNQRLPGVELGLFHGQRLVRLAPIVAAECLELRRSRDRAPAEPFGADTRDLGLQANDAAGERTLLRQRLGSREIDQDLAGANVIAFFHPQRGDDATGHALNGLAITRYADHSGTVYRRVEARKGRPADEADREQRDQGSADTKFRCRIMQRPDAVRRSGAEECERGHEWFFRGSCATG